MFMNHIHREVETTGGNGSSTVAAKPAADAAAGSGLADAAKDAAAATEAAIKAGATAEEVQALRAKSEKFDKLNTRYLQDESFRKRFDNAWKGSDEEKAAVPAAAADGEPPAHDPMKAFRDEMEGLRNELHGVKSELVNERVVNYRDGINSSYETELKNLADSVGYQPGTPAYRSLHTEVVDNARQLAEKYGLKDESGNANPLVKFSKELLKESFDKAAETHRQAGFLDAWEAKKQIEVRKAENAPATERKAFFEKNKENMKSTEGRGKVMEQWLKKKFPDIMR